MTGYAKELILAKKIAQAIGRSLVRAQGAASIASRKKGSESFDYTTHQDLEAERMAIALIKKSFPRDAILSEETLHAIDDIPARLWIIDPIDGTANYANGMDTFAVSVSFYARERVRASAVFLPAKNELYAAERGRGVKLNGKPLLVKNPERDLKRSFVNMGFPHQRTKPVVKHSFAWYADLLHACADLRRTGSAVLDTVLVASGKSGAYVTPNIKPWDIAAGVLFVEEQGGVVSDLRGKPLDLFKKVNGKFAIEAAFSKNKIIHSALIRVTKKYF